MEEIQIYYIVLYSFLTLAVVVFITLLFMAAPYGRHLKKGWGPLINNKLGWILQEAPASLLMLLYLFVDSRPINAVMVLLFVIWQTHYFHRTFIYPFTLRGDNRVPLATVLFAILFNIVNTYMQGRWLFKLSPEGMYTLNWLTDPRFIIGVALFYAGYIINKNSDIILRNLRKPGDSGYKIPYSGLFTYVSCPNYLGEIITWLGWAIATWSLAGVFFLVWTIANLGPRAWAHHQWYKKTFPDYPVNRKVLVPYIF